MAIDVYLESGAKRVFAGAVEWPGLCRSARTAEAALTALVAYAPRYAKAVASTRLGFNAPINVASMEVVERLRGGATTDFGAPEIAPKADERKLDAAGAKRQAALLRAAWRYLDRTIEKYEGVKLATGPRGGGRDISKIANHVFEAERAYLAILGGRYKGTDLGNERAAVLDALASHARGEAPLPRRSTKVWSPRYFVRRAMWHVLDHAWEIEERAG